MDRSGTIAWIEKMVTGWWPQETEVPDWENVVGTEPRSERGWRNEAIRAFGVHIPSIPDKLAKMINKTYAEGKVDYTVVDGRLMWTVERYGARKTGRMMPCNSNTTRVINRAAEMDAEIKANQNKLEPLKTSLKERAKQLFTNVDKVICVDTGDAAAHITDRRRHTISDGSHVLPIVRKIWEDHPEVVSIVGHMQIKPGMESKVYKILEKEGKADLLEWVENVQFDEKSYDNLLASGEDVGQLEEIVTTNHTYAIRLDRPE